MDKLTKWKKGVETAKEYGLYYHYRAVEELLKEIETYQLQETLLLDRLQKMTLEIKEMKQNSRLTRFYDMAEENLKLAQELALLKGEMSG